MSKQGFLWRTASAVSNTRRWKKEFDSLSGADCLMVINNSRVCDCIIQYGQPIGILIEADAWMHTEELRKELKEQFPSYNWDDLLTESTCFTIFR